MPNAVVKMIDYRPSFANQRGHRQNVRDVETVLAVAEAGSFRKAGKLVDSFSRLGHFRRVHAEI